ncbi:M15 family metallopeptidase [Henriciella mobilis]|uniref:D-alanyl-D-alanine dipeptidase n=1 Tax=Henriciella mobilis TaxID=2305467 RepID=A0A399R7R3_9PROT|nr:M15 family metallopeptidase [Henriciella mobilis]RIJ14741.1 peptidase M15 [Henriciella mobilis]RIJ21698.1 peptidase M15 [Henriciella mobilis]RIJ26803.1 peptidase M15 [Henriciella mobilis]
MSINPVKALLWIALFSLVACASIEERESETVRPDGFVRVAEHVPGLIEDVRYHTADNFVGAPIDGYEAPVCLLTREAADALGEVQAELAGFGLGLKVFDCYRPARAVAHFARWARDLDDQSTKPVYYPNVEKSQLFELGYIAEKSGHSRGSTMDLTIVDLASLEAIDMGSPFDLFDPLSWPSDPRPSKQQRANRAFLNAIMTAHGFKGLREEWWHFTLVDEPYPDTYFDFVIR